MARASASERVRRAPDDAAVVLEAVGEDGKALRFANETLRGDQGIVAVAVAADAGALEFASEALQDDRELVRTALAKDGCALAFASEDLRSDSELVLQAVRQSKSAVIHAAYELFCDRAFVLAVVKLHGRALEHACDVLRRDPEIAEVACAECGEALRFCDEASSDNREVVLAAIRSQPLSLIYASRRLRRDQDVVGEAVRRSADSLAHADESLQRDQRILLEVIRRPESERPWRWVSQELLNSHDFMMEALKRCPRTVERLPPSILGDRTFVMSGLQQLAQGSALLRRASRELRRDWGFMAEAVRLKSIALVYASEELLSDMDFVLACIAANPSARRYIPCDMRRDREFMMRAVSRDAMVLEYASMDLRLDTELAITALRQDRACFVFLGVELQGDLDMQLVAYAQGGNPTVDAPPRAWTKQFRCFKASRIVLDGAVRDACKRLLAKGRKRQAATQRPRASFPREVWLQVMGLLDVSDSLRTGRAARELRAEVLMLLPRLCATVVISETTLCPPGAVARGPHGLRRRKSSGGLSVVDRFSLLLCAPRLAPLLRSLDMSLAPVDLIRSVAQDIVGVPGLKHVRYPRTGWGSLKELRDFESALDARGITHEACPPAATAGVARRKLRFTDSEVSNR